MSEAFVNDRATITHNSRDVHILSVLDEKLKCRFTHCALRSIILYYRSAMRARVTNQLQTLCKTLHYYNK